MAYEAHTPDAEGPVPEKPEKYEWFEEPKIVYSDVDTVRFYFPDVEKYMSITFHFASNEMHTKFLESARTSSDFEKYGGRVFYHMPYDKEVAAQAPLKQGASRAANINSEAETDDADLEAMLGLSIPRIRRASRLAKELFFKGRYTPGILDGTQDTIEDIERVLAKPPLISRKDEKKTEPISYVPPTPESPYLPKVENETVRDDETRFGPENWPKF